MDFNPDKYEGMNLVNIIEAGTCTTTGKVQGSIEEQRDLAYRSTDP